jgi:malonyl CoA-acyl carrier protein transacylase
LSVVKVVLSEVDPVVLSELVTVELPDVVAVVLSNDEGVSRACVVEGNLKVVSRLEVDVESEVECREEEREDDVDGGIEVLERTDESVLPLAVRDPQLYP